MKAVLWKALLQFTVYVFHLSFHPSSHFLSNEQFDNCFNKHLLETDDLYFPLEVNLFSTSRLPVCLVHSCCTTYLNHGFSYPSTQLKRWFSSWLPHNILLFDLDRCNLVCLISFKMLLQRWFLLAHSFDQATFLLEVFKEQLLLYYKLNSLISIPQASQFSSSLIFLCLAEMLRSDRPAMQACMPDHYIPERSAKPPLHLGDP